MQVAGGGHFCFPRRWLSQQAGVTGNGSAARASPAEKPRASPCQELGTTLGLLGPMAGATSLGSSDTGATRVRATCLGCATGPMPAGGLGWWQCQCQPRCAGWPVQHNGLLYTGRGSRDKRGRAVDTGTGCQRRAGNYRLAPICASRLDGCPLTFLGRVPACPPDLRGD